MSAAAETKVRDVLGACTTTPESEDALFESTRALGELRQKVTSSVSALAARGLVGTVLDGVLATLDIPLGRVLAGAWNGYRELRSHADPKKHPPGEVVLVPLAKHTVRSTHRPSVDVLVDGNKVGSLAFELVLSLELEAGLFEIEGGRIRALRAGKCTGKAKLSCEGAVLVERSTPEVPLPQRLAFEGGIPLSAG